jgi:SPP1 gp7 family putative phage head morphogenesis protein
VRRANSPRPPRAAALAMSKELRRRLALFEAVIERLLFPVLDEFAPVEDRSLVVSAPDENEARTRVDARTPARVLSRLSAIELHLASIFDERDVDNALDVIGKRVATSNGVEIQRVIGIAIREADPGVAAFIDNWRAINVSRIKSLAGRELVEISQLLERAEPSGLRVEVLRKQIEERFAVTRSKADLLARDQTLTLNSQITRQRQTNVGIESYIWTTSGDDRVRGLDPNDSTDHASLDGTVQRWDNPPDVGDGRRLHPGEDYQCRCTAFPVLPELA